MANILLRSPRFESLTNASAAYGILELSINGTLQYTITKDAVTQGATKIMLFDISELCRDYLNISFSGSYSLQSISITGLISAYDSEAVLLATSDPISHIGYDGYGTFKEGTNPTWTGLGQSNTIVYVPEGTTANIPTSSGYVSSSSEVTFVAICEPKYSPIKVTFLNRFGNLQDIWFFKKSIQRIATRDERFNRTIVNQDGSYSTNEHTRKILRRTGNQSVTANTGFVSELLNPAMEELMMSEYTWATIDSVIYPINITSQALEYKTSLNDKVINYTIDFEYANEVLNNVR
jgi:hypothetical protein